LIDSTKRKFHKETQTGNAWTTIGCNTDLSLCHSKYDELLASEKAIESLLEERLFKKSLCINTQAISDFFAESPSKESDPVNQGYNKQLVEVLGHTIKPTFAMMINKGSVNDLDALLLARKEAEEQSVAISDTSGSPIRFGKNYISPVGTKQPFDLDKPNLMMQVVKVEEDEHSSDESSKDAERPADLSNRHSLHLGADGSARDRKSLLVN
jgi:hypothetical protein